MGVNDDLKGKIERSLSAMREHLPVREFSAEYPLIVNFSGGKDSTACLLLARELTDHVEALYMDAGFELPNTLDYVRDRAHELGVKLHISGPLTYPVPHRPGGIPQNVRLLEDYVRHYKYWPTSACRWCSIWCKQRPAKQLIRKKWGKKPIYKFVGVKIADSPRRKHIYGNAAVQERLGGRWVRPDREMPGTFVTYPILEWTSDDCKAYIRANGLDLHDGYKLFGVSGCAWCPVYKPETVRKIARVYPHIYDKLIAAEQDIGKPAWTHKGIWLEDVVAAAQEDDSVSIVPREATVSD